MNQRVRVVYIIISCFIVIGLMIKLDCENYSKQIEKTSMKYINPYAVKLKWQINEKTLQIFSQAHNDGTLWQVSDVQKDSVVGALFNANEKGPKIIKGRFFNTSDFFSGKRVVVIGKEQLDLVKKQDGKNIIDLFGKEYKVIGVMGYKRETSLDYCIFYNLDSNITQDIFYLDSRSKRNVEKIVEQLKRYEKVQVIDDKPKGAISIFKYSNNAMKITILQIILLLGTIYIATKYYCKGYMTNARTQYLLGINKKRIIQYIVTHQVREGTFIGILSVCIYLIVSQHLFTGTILEYELGVNKITPYFIVMLVEFILPMVVCSVFFARRVVKKIDEDGDC